MHCTLSFDLFHIKDNSHNNQRDNTDNKPSIRRWKDQNANTCVNNIDVTKMNKLKKG